MAEKVYPDWVQKHRTKGTTVKKVGNNYYLYKHSSRRVPGKKYPVPKDTYLGKITPEGVEKSVAKKVATEGAAIIVKEYGFSKAVELLCPAGWKEPLGKDWQPVLDYIITRESPESYITQIRKVPEAFPGNGQYGAQKSSLMRRMRNEHGIDLNDLDTLKTVYIVNFAGKDFISLISEGQKKILEMLGIRLEVR